MRLCLMFLFGWVLSMNHITLAEDFGLTGGNAPSTTSNSWHAEGKQGAVVAGGAEAVDAGVQILKSGGNAADAAVATILALSVTDATLFCFGGEVSIIVYDAKQRRVETLAGLGAAPKMATREFFATCGIPSSGVRAATVPAVVDACVTLLSRHGTKTFRDVAQPTLVLLKQHREPWHQDLETTLNRLIGAEQSGDGDRSTRLQRVSEYFYRGPLAEELIAWSEANNGLLRKEDLAAHVTQIEPPVSIDYRGHQIYKCGPWTQGPWLLEALQMLEGFEIGKLGHNSPETIHLATEAMKLAMADRDVYYADPRYVEVPLDALLSKEYAALRRPLIDRKRASQELRPGDPRKHLAVLDEVAARKGLGNPDHDTTTCLVADSAGNVIAATPSGWSGVLAGNTGVWLGSRLQSFNTWADHPNCIAPGKRPRITLTPTLVLKDEQPVMAVSVAGGDGQDQATLQMLLNRIDFGLSPQACVTAPRFGTNHFISSFGQKPPQLGSLLLYPGMKAETVAELTARGHAVSVYPPPLWHPVVLVIDRKTGLRQVAGDPKAARNAAAY